MSVTVPEVSVLIPGDPARALAAIEPHIAEGRMELILTGLPSGSQGSAQPVRNVPGPGRSAAGDLNRAAGTASGMYLLFLDPRVVPEPGSVDALLHLMSSRPDCAIVAGRILSTEATIRDVGVAFDQAHRPCRILRGYPAQTPGATQVREIEAATASCFLVRKDLFREFGGLEEHLGLDLAAVNLSLRCRERGRCVLLCPEATCHCSEAGEVDPQTVVGQGDKRALRLFRSRWASKLDRLRLPGDLVELRPSGYHQDARTEILELIPPSARSLLDIGCGAGMLGMGWKAIVPQARIWGVEIDESVAREAERRLERVFVGDVERLELPIDESTRFDCIVFADILEHLKDPWSLLRRARGWLAENGRIVASVPNVRHLPVLMDLMRGRWAYRPEGILDVDHLRFFTLHSLRAMFESCGYELIRVERNRKAARTLRVANRLLGGRLDGLLTKKYYVVCRALGAPTG